MTSPLAKLTSFGEYLFLIQFGPTVLESVAILCIDLSDDDMTIIFCTPLLEEMFGYHAGELRGQLLGVLLTPDKRDIHLQHFQRFKQEPFSRTMNSGVWVDGLRKDGKIVKVQISLSVRRIGGSDCIIALVCDVTKAYEHICPQIPPLTTPAKA